MLIFKIGFWISIFLIFWANIGYPLSLLLLDQFYSNKKINKNYALLPSVTVMVVAHNEELVIENKLNNLLSINYPKDKFNVLVTSDNSTDSTNEIVRDFIEKNSEYNIKLFEVKKRMGKTNAQNEAQKMVETEYLVMTDANSMIAENAIIELMAAFTEEDVAYVCGKLVYTNGSISNVSSSESGYWNLDLKMRDIEGRIQTITAGNGALYACRTDEYIDFDPINGHDISMPTYFALKGKKAIMNPQALVYEKAGETVSDEFDRRVRMNRNLLKRIIPSLSIFNFSKYKWYSYFYLGHRTSRYLLWLSHLLLLISSIFLNYQNSNLIYFIALIGQLLFFSIAVIQILFKTNNSIANLISHYFMTVIAQLVGVYKILTGQTKPFWEKAESTR